jgi:hypothetical protein
MLSWIELEQLARNAEYEAVESGKRAREMEEGASWSP